MKSTETKLLLFIIILFTLTNCYKKEIPETIYLPNILTEDNADQNAFLSPDGQKIAFQSLRNTFDPYYSGYNFELWIMDKNGANQHLLFGSTNSDY